MTTEELLEKLQAIESGLTGWEMDFIESISQQFEEKKELSEKQMERAEQILYDKG
jgi:hypothetical protein